MTQKEYLKSIGTELKVARIRIDMSTQQLSKLTGLSTACLLQIERGATDPKLSSLRRMSEALGVSLKDIL